MGSTLITHLSHWSADSKKSLYGLKQAPREWFTKLSETLNSTGYTHSKVDYSLFTKNTQDTVTLVIIYMDDLLITGNSTAAISELKGSLASQFHMKDLGPVTYFLGLEIDRSSNGFFISQKKYTLNLLQEFGMLQATPLKLPMDTHIKLTPDK